MLDGPVCLEIDLRATRGLWGEKNINDSVFKSELNNKYLELTHNLYTHFPASSQYCRASFYFFYFYFLYWRSNFGAEHFKYKAIRCFSIILNDMTFPYCEAWKL